MCDNGEFNLAERLLCSDDSCIGLVGPDGKCKVCGTPYIGDDPLPTPTSHLVSTTEASTSEETQSPDEVSPETDTDGINADDADTDDIYTEETDTDDRICCPDDSCIGIIGTDGRCGTCGKEG